MMARGFKPVGWVAGVAAAALSCYMLSLNVASERAELAKLERSIITAKRDIRTLQTELGTRGRLQQLESWNANVLALSAPTSAQFLDNELTLARFDQREESIEERSTVHMASAPTQAAPKVQQKIEAPVHYASAPAAQKPVPPLVHQASLVIEDKPAVQPKPIAAPKPVAVEAKAAVTEKKPVAATVTSTAAKPEKKPAAPAKTVVAEKKADAPKKAAATSEKPAKEARSKPVKSEGAGGR